MDLPEQTFSDDYFISTGIHVVFRKKGTTENLLSGWKFRDVNKSATTVDQQEVSHQLSGSSYKEHIPTMSDAGDATVAAYFEPKKAPPIEASVSACQGTSGELFFAYYDEKTQAPYYFFYCEANLQEYGDFAGAIGTPATCNFKFKLSGKPLYADAANAKANGTA